MPRPKKRSRVASSRVPAKESEPAVAAATTQLVRAEPKIPTGFSSDIYDVSDREKERRKSGGGAELDAARGGTGEKEGGPETEDGTKRGTRQSIDAHATSRQARELAHARRRRDEALRHPGKPSTETSTAQRNAQESSDSLEVETPPIELGRRGGVAVATRLSRPTDVSGLDLDDDIFGGLDDSLGMDLGLGDDDLSSGDERSAEATAQTGGRSADTSSSFNVAVFKRRPRASSVAGRNDAPIRPSSRGPNTPSVGSTLNLGLFRRRAREPSILGTAHKDRSARAQSHVSASEGEGEGAIEEHFQSDGTGAPLDRGRPTRRSLLAEQAVLSRDASPTGRQSHKRKSLEKHDGREKRTALEADQEEERQQQLLQLQIATQHLAERDDSSDISVPSLLRSNRLYTPQQDDDPDMAPPASSGSSDGSPTFWPPLEALAHRSHVHRGRRPASRAANKTPEPLADDGSDVPSPPSLTHSPNYTAPKARPTRGRPRGSGKATTTRQPSPKVMTADLASLLPRRRHRRRASRGSPFDMSSSGHDEGDFERSASSDSESNDNDELSYHVSSRAASRRRAAKRPGTSGNNSNKKVAAGQKAPTTPTPALAGAAAAAAKKSGYRTYGSARNSSNNNNSDKENEPCADGVVVGGDDEGGNRNEAAGEGDGEDESPGEVSQERLAQFADDRRNAVAKFKEVDRWELAFEEVTGSSSPRDAR